MKVVTGIILRFLDILNLMQLHVIEIFVIVLQFDDTFHEIR